MLIIGIAGGTGSGKTTVVNQIIKQLPIDEVCVISQDSYYNATDNMPYEERAEINFSSFFIRHIVCCVIVRVLRNHAYLICR